MLRRYVANLWTSSHQWPSCCRFNSCQPCLKLFPFKAWLSSDSIKHVPYMREPMDRNVSKSPQIMTAQQAVSDIQSHHRVFVHSAAMVPTVLLKALAAHSIDKNLKNVRVYHIHIDGEPIITHPDCYGHLRSCSFFTGANCRKAVEDGYADFVPIFLSEISMLFLRNIIPLDYALIQVSPPDEHGYCTLGSSVDVTRSALQTAKKVIAQVNSNVPRVFGWGAIHQSNIDIMVQHDEPLLQHKSRAPTQQDITIGKLIAENLVDDGATLQLGIGAIPDMVLKYLDNHKGLGVHSEMISDGIVDLYMSGVINNSHKVVLPGKTVSSFAIGSNKLYDFMHENTSFVMTETSFTNDISVIGKNPKVTAINSCIEVDLTGQVCADSIGTRIYSGVGGQLDFVTGAARAEDGKGKPILAMHSSTKRGESKIVPLLKTGSGVVTTRSHVHYLVTEYGIAYLFGKNLIQRAYELIKISHPSHREALEKAAFERLKAMPSPD